MLGGDGWIVKGEGGVLCGLSGGFEGEGRGRLSGGGGLSGFSQY